MSLVRDILETYRAPRRVVRKHLSGPRREDRALVFLMLACAVIFVAQWPLLARQAALDPAVPLEARLGAALLAWVFFAPLFFYGLAAFSHVAVGLFWKNGSWYSARIALFWTLLAVGPLFLLRGLVAGFIGPGPALALVGVAVVVAFFGIWTAAIVEAEVSPGLNPASQGS